MEMKFNAGRFFRSFGFAVKGLGWVFRDQQNLRVHVCVAVLVLIAGSFATLTPPEWCILVTVIFLVLAMEVMNSAIEKLVDFISPGHHEQAGIVKDISAGAVLLTAIGAVIVGMIIFLPKLADKISSP